MVQQFLTNQADAFDDIQAAPESQDFEYLLRGHQRTGVLSGFAVTESSPTAQTIDVSAGEGVETGEQISGPASLDLAVSSADPTNPRKDLISINPSGVAVVTAGTPAAVSPAAPALPANSIPIAVLTVLANDDDHENAQISDKRVIVAERYVVNVKDFGATGDGSTDDSTSIQAAIDYIEGLANPMALFFPVGEYRCVTGLVFDKGLIRIIGAGGQSRSEVAPDGATLVAMTNAMELLRINSTTSLIHEGPIIEHMNFRDNSAANTAVLLRIHNINRWTVRNCTFRDASATGGVGLQLTRESGGDNAWGIIDQCTFTSLDLGISAVRSFGFTMIGGHMTGGGMLLDDLTQHVKVFGTKFDQDGIVIEGMQCSIQACSFENTDPGVRFNDTGSGHGSRRNSLIGCAFAGGGTETGIDFAGTDPNNNIITACTFTSLATDISLLAAGFANVIKANQKQRGVLLTFVGVNLDWRHDIISADTTSPQVLPDATTYDGKSYLIRRRGGNQVIIDVSGSDTFDDSDTQKTLDSQGAAIGVFSDGSTSWRIVGTEGSVGGS